MPRLSESALADLRARNPVAAVAARLGVNLRRSGRSFIGPCPLCGGGKTSARFEVKSEQQWVCAVCPDGGDVIRLVEKMQGVDFRAAVAWLGGADDIDPAEAARRGAALAAQRVAREIEAARYREAERKRLWRRWTDCATAAPDLSAYLDARGLSLRPGVLRFDPAAPYFHGEEADGQGRRTPRVIHRGPAMVAAILRPDGKFGGLHFTWLDAHRPGEKAVIADPDTGEVLPAKKVRGTKAAGHIPLVPLAAPTRLVMGEGIETVLSPAETPYHDGRTAFWSAVDLGNLGGPAFATVPHPTLKAGNGHPRRVPGPEPAWAEPAIVIPDSVTELILLGDGDSERFLTAMALQRGAARHARPDRTVRIAWAPDDCDINDVLRGRAA